MSAEFDDEFDPFDLDGNPWEKPDPETGLVASRLPPLHNVVVRFGVLFDTPLGAESFARAFGVTYQRSGVTVRGRVAWMVFCCSAADAQDAALQAAVAVKAVTVDRRRMLDGATPNGSRFHDAHVTGRVPAGELVRAHADRRAALERAAAWGLLSDDLVTGAHDVPLLSARRALGPAGPAPGLPDRRYRGRM